MHYTQNKTAIICILGLLATVSPLAIDLYLAAFASIAESFNTTTARISLSVTSYFIGLAFGQVLYGPPLDRFGRKLPLYMGLIIFISASIWCTQVQSDTMLIIARFIQAIGGSVAWVAAITMVRDFYPVEESAKRFSLLILILGISPLIAPTIGSFILVNYGWQAIFLAIAFIGLLAFAMVYLFLPHGQAPDRTVSLSPLPIIRTFFTILKEPQFFTYGFSGAFSFATLSIYVAASPVIFMDVYKVEAKVYGLIFAVLSVGFVGSSQLNIFLNKKMSSEMIFKIALTVQAIASTVFLIGSFMTHLNIYFTVGLFFISLSCVGLMNPNANALALAPFKRNIGSASSLLGFIQLGIAALASAGVGLFYTDGTSSIALLMMTTALMGLLILTVGRKTIIKSLVHNTEFLEGGIH